MLNLDFFNFINTAHGQSLGGTVDAALGKQEDAYQQIQSFDGSPNQKIPFSDQNSQVDGLASQINYIVTFMMIVLIVGIILRLIYGAVQKGTSDNIFGQKKGNEMIKNAGEVLVSFILIYSVLSWINPDLTGWNVAIKALDTKITTSEKDTSGTPALDAECPSNPYGGNVNIKDMLKTDEGYSEFTYLDGAGNKTIGVGFNLNRSNAKDSLKRAGVSDAKISALISYPTPKDNIKKKEGPSLDQITIDRLFENDIQEHKRRAIDFVKNKTDRNFNDLSIKTQNVLIDMTFTLGSLDSFPKFTQALKDNNTAKMAQEIINSKYCVDVKDRCYRMAALIHSTCGVIVDNSTNQTAETVPGFGGGECNATSKQRTFNTEMIRVALSSNNSAGNKILLDIKDIDNNKNNAQYGFNVNNRCRSACEKGCTTLGGIPSIVVDLLSDLLKRCNSYSNTDKCIIIITGGTEWGHYSHMPGVSAIDLSYIDNSLLNKFIKNLNPAGNSNNCVQRYSFIDGINHKGWFFCEEQSKSNSNTTGKHWHVSKARYN